ncbi:MAG TPA: substrate-binding domain-containing protein, partial [Geobacteraceae bacterium]|nr:substrate-binding domain-containing protein [Geobacteraceae bacterium]
NLVKGFGSAGVQIYSEYAGLLDKVSGGEALFGYNVPAGEAFRRSGNDPAVGVLYAYDYTLATPQTILMTKGAPHPAAARLWIDYILSSRGQGILAQGSNLFPVRGDTVGGEISRQPQKLPVGRGLKVMMPAGEITRYNEQGIRKGFVLRWKQMLNSKK